MALSIRLKLMVWRIKWMDDDIRAENADKKECLNVRPLDLT